MPLVYKAIKLFHMEIEPKTAVISKQEKMQKFSVATYESVVRCRRPACAS